MIVKFNTVFIEYKFEFLYKIVLNFKQFFYDCEILSCFFSIKEMV